MSGYVLTVFDCLGDCIVASVFDTYYEADETRHRLALRWGDAVTCWVAALSEDPESAVEAWL